MTPQPTTPEAKLAAIIEAQVKGGYLMFDEVPAQLEGETYWVDGKLILCEATAEKIVVHILEILLDPQGLKAAYGDAPNGMTAEEYRFTGLREWHRDCGHKILDSWLSGGAEAAIHTAFDLLSQKQ